MSSLQAQVEKSLKREALIRKATRSSDLGHCDYQTVDVDRLAAIAQSARHGSALIRVRDSVTDMRKSCDEAAKLNYARDWNIALEIIWHKALGMARRGRWKCRPDQIIKLSRLALVQYVGGACSVCFGRKLINMERDGTAKAAPKPCPCCNGSGERPQTNKHIVAMELQASIVEVESKWMDRLNILAGAVDGLRRSMLSEAGRRLK